MDLSRRDFRQSQASGAAGAPMPAAEHGHSGKRKRGFSIPSLRFITMFLFFCVTVLVLSLISYSVLSSNFSEGNRIDKKNMQAVFLNGGQVYFGNIKTLNDHFIRLDNIYYLRVNQQVQPDQNTSSSQNNDVSLVKLGCELHGPQDEMLINRDQVIFWENLKDNGQVEKAVAQFVQQNPNGQTCAANSSASPTPTTPSPSPSSSTKK